MFIDCYNSDWCFKKRETKLQSTWTKSYGHKIIIVGSHKATVWMSISSVQPGKGNFWTRDWRTARAPSAVPAPLHIEKAVLHAYSQESFTGEVGPVDMTCLTTEYGLKKTNCGRLVVLNFHWNSNRETLELNCLAWTLGTCFFTRLHPAAIEFEAKLNRFQDSSWKGKEHDW